MTFMNSFFLTSALSSDRILYSYDWPTVAVSIIVAVISSILSLQVAGVARLARSSVLRQFALISGSLALGGGIWSMHFLGMLAIDVGLHVHYDSLITLVSIAPSIFASWVALQILSSNSISSRHLIIGGTLVGAGIGAMHYSGMMAMQMSAAIVYDPLMFSISIIVAVSLAIFSLWVKFKLTEYVTLSALKITMLAGTIMGCAISGMHYTGMAATHIISQAPHIPASLPNNFSNLIIQIGATTLGLSLFVFIGNLLLRYRELNGQLQESESRIRAILGTAVDGIISIDGHGCIIDMNKAAEDLLGWNEDEVRGKNINILMPEPYHSEHDQYLKNYHTTGEKRIIGKGREVVAKRKDGTHVPVRLAVGQADIPGQKLFVGFISDISERIAMEREIRAKETQYRTLIYNIPGVTFRCEPTLPWRTLFVSDSIFSLSGWHAEDFLANTLSLGDLTHPDDINTSHITVSDALLHKKSYTIEYRIRDRQGMERWVSQSASGVYDDDGNIMWIDGVIIEITEAKKRNAEFEGIVRSIERSLLFIEFDLDGKILDANDNFIELIDYPLSHLKTLHYQNILCTEEESSVNLHFFWNDLNQGQFQSGEYCLTGNNGRRVWVQTTFNPILDSDGKPWKIVALGNDLSHRKAMETDLFIAKNKAEQASIAKGMFLANMSHEIRTPMNSIIGFTDLLMDSNLSEGQHKHLKTIQHSARSLLGLLNDILDTAKLERSAVDLELHPFSLRDLSEQVVQEQRAHADKKSLTLKIDYPSQLRDFVTGDILRVRQILVNLIGNAVKFTEQGEVVLRIRERGNNIIMEVSDTGIGIASDRLTHIFIPFTQADASMARRFGGTGLGTTIARQLTELMGGRISVTSVEGEGSTFTVDIPLPRAEAILHSPDAINIELPKLRFLIADDVPQNIELLEILLRRDNHEVVSVTDGAAAAAAFRQQPFDIVLMDIQMPLVDGLEATKQIRRWEAEQGLSPIPVIALTASVLERDRKQAKEVGMNSFASKPIDILEIYTQVALALGILSPTTITAKKPSENLSLDWQGAMNRWNDQERLINAIDKFLQELRIAIEDLSHFNSQELAYLLHKFKGAAANLGLQKIANTLLDAETSNKNFTEFKELLTILIVQSQVVTDHYRVSTPHETQVSRAIVSAQDLESLQQHFLQGAIDDTLIMKIKAAAPTAEFNTLQRAVDDFDLDKAAYIVNSWITSATWVNKDFKHA